jgi:hypothetical protein
MHWRTTSDDATNPTSIPVTRDPIDPDQIGTGSTGTKGHKGSIRVRMRFPTSAAAEAAWTSAAKDVLPGAKGFYVTIDVPVVEPVRPSPTDDLHWEVRVDW